MRSRIVFATTLVTLALGCCWAAMPTTPTASLLEAYRETGLAKECNHRPYCQRRDYHEQQLALDELCYESPRCPDIRSCLLKHIEFVYGQGCLHSPRCTN